MFQCLTVSFAACQSGWRSFNGYCYKFVSEKKSWHASESYCGNVAPANTNGNLASIGDDATNMFLSTISSGKQAWIGGHQDSENQWSWSDGRNWNFTYWATNQPNSGGEDQKYISTNFREDGKWNDNNGNSVRQFLCQYSTGNTIHITHIAAHKHL